MNYTRIAKLANRIQSRRTKRGQKGFTLLELLVVVAILAAIAGTATIALQDTDARASAAAHVAMMDELNKGIATFRVLNRNVYPTAFDSLLESTNTGFNTDPANQDATPNDAVGGTVDFVSTFAANEGGDFTIDTIDATIATVIADSGLDSLMYVDASFTAYTDGSSGQGPEDSANKTCALIYGDDGLIMSRSNAVVPGNIFLTPAANGCGVNANIVSGQSVALWKGNYERILGFPGAQVDAGDTSGAPVMMAVGIGPASTLFENGVVGSMTSVPVYRHVSGSDYNRFIALFSVGQLVNNNTSGPAAELALDTWTAIDQVNLVTVIDGAGDTKEEELGEWDGSRNTI